MGVMRRVLRKPLKLLRRLSGQPLSALETAIQFVTYNDVPGDYLEFGVLGGGSMIRSYHYHRTFAGGFRERNGLDKAPRRRFFAFDSFEGLPVVEQTQLPPHWRGEGAMSSPQKRFLDNLNAAKVDLNDVFIVPGFFDQSLTPEVRERHQMTEAAIIHVDCDLYESTLPVLEFIRPLLVDGCVIVFDDWFYYKGHPAKGERGAFENWLARNPEICASDLYLGFPQKAFILNFRDA